MFKIALCQMAGSRKKDMRENKNETKEKAARMIREAAAAGASMAVLPEMWNCPYTGNLFEEYGEPESGESVHMLSALAKELGIYIVGGSIPEIEPGSGRIYNTCFIFDDHGNVIGKHRKAHLFDLEVKEHIGKNGKKVPAICFRESDTLSAGDSSTVVDVVINAHDGKKESFKMGVAICYDVRFPEFFRRMALDGAKLIVLPGAFNMTTGPAHWDVTMRARAIDNQVYFAACSPARDMELDYHAYGSSCVVTPWGDFVAHADANEGVIYADVDLEYVESVRNRLRLYKHRRPELY